MQSNGIKCFSTCNNILAALESHFGNDGYAFYFKMLEMLASSKDRSLDCNDDASWQAVVSYARLQPQTVTDILTMLADLGAINWQLWTEKRIVKLETIGKNSIFKSSTLVELSSTHDNSQAGLFSEEKVKKCIPSSSNMSSTLVQLSSTLSSTLVELFELRKTFSPLIYNILLTSYNSTNLSILPRHNFMYLYTEILLLEKNIYKIRSKTTNSKSKKSKKINELEKLNFFDQNPYIDGENEDENELMKRIINDFNSVAGKRFSTDPIDTQVQKLIRKRLAEGHTFEEFQKVHRVKTEQWKGDPTMERYLRPQTLYTGKFEAYLAEADIKKKVPFDHPDWRPPE